MKRMFTALLTFALLFSLSVPASADILWEPYDNSYYMAHTEDMTTIAAAYGVPEGMTVNLYTSPTNGHLIKTLEAGTRVYVGFSTTVGGEVWATGYAYGDWENEGWFRLGRLQKEYCHDDFIKDYAESITNAEETLTAAAISTEKLNGDVPTWTWPGSGVPDGTLPFDGSERGYNDGLLTFSRIYTDPEGGQWGYVGYYMGHCGWVYLDDVYTDNPPVRLYPEVENTVTDTSAEESAPVGTTLWILVPVAVLILATGSIIAIMKKKK